LATGAALAATGRAVMATADAPRIKVLIISHSSHGTAVAAAGHQRFQTEWVPEDNMSGSDG
jgi:hypothetical protein